MNEKDKFYRFLRFFLVSCFVTFLLLIVLLSVVYFI